MQYHQSVLLKESVDALEVSEGGVYVDVTFGGGGHSREILSRAEDCSLYAFDQDEDALENELDDDRLTLIHSNFSDLENSLKLYRENQVDGILADLGVSSHQFDAEERGFSIRFDGPLDMRMDQKGAIDASLVVNQYSLEKLTTLLKNYGEVKGAFRIAEQIITSREEKPIVTTHALIEVLKPLIPERFLNKTLAQVFQAIRIEVNQELEVIKTFLVQSTELLVKQGRLVCIAYHSLEDRLVKRYIREGLFEGQAPQDFFGNRNYPLKKLGNLIVPDQNEIKRNSRARSAKMRIAEKQ